MSDGVTWPVAVDVEGSSCWVASVRVKHGHVCVYHASASTDLRMIDTDVPLFSQIASDVPDYIPEVSTEEFKPSSTANMDAKSTRAS